MKIITKSFISDTLTPKGLLRCILGWKTSAGVVRGRGRISFIFGGDVIKLLNFGWDMMRKNHF